MFKYKYIIVLILFCSSCRTSITEGILYEKFYEKERVKPNFYLEIDDEDYVFIIEHNNGKDTIYRRYEVNYEIFNKYNLKDSVKIIDILE